ncbi:MAG TPA: alginate export family protein [Gemmatimonadaceae bacterium]
MRTLIVGISAVVLGAPVVDTTLWAQGAPAGAPASGAPPVQISASVRARAESWDWFDAGAAGEYSYAHLLARVSTAQSRAHWSWRVEGAVPVLLGLPDDATLAAPGGQLGLGSTYYAANDAKRNVASVFVKQAFVRWTANGHALRVGRFEFADGAERAPADPTLAAVKAQRVGQRLIGPFGFSAVGRSFDGLHYTGRVQKAGLTVAAVRPTAGAFRADAQPGLDINVAYAALTTGARATNAEHDLRLFGLWYDDERGTVPTDNRAAAARSADRSAIEVLTLGGHWTAIFKSGRAKFDAVAWGAWQGGDWGRLDHAANAVALEGGFQHAALPWGTWIRAGVLRTSGDDNAGDNRHETFFQALPTPRVYARMPFYNMMNSSETFATVQAKPHAKVTLRAGAHALELTEARDLWYLGGGAFDSRVFGFAGRPSSGATPLARVMDVSVAWQPHARLAVELYGASARGGAVVQGAYAGNRVARFLYLETTLSR